MMRRETSSTSAAVASRLRSRVPPHQVLLQLTTSHGVCPVQRRQRHCLSWIAPEPTQMAKWAGAHSPAARRMVRLHAGLVHWRVGAIASTEGSLVARKTSRARR